VTRAIGHPSGQTLLDLRAKNVALNHTQGIDRGYVLTNLNPQTAGVIRSALEKELGWNIISAATTVANVKKRTAEAKSEGAVVSSG